MTLEEKIAMANQVRSRDRFGSVSPEEQAALPGTETELWIKTANGCKIHVFEERPDTLPPKAELLLNFHGGGFIKGRTDRDRRYCCTLMERLNCLVWDVDYCLAPEKAFPAAVHESYGIAEYAFDHAEELGVDPEKIILAGHSAGGNLVAAACIQNAETHKLHPCCVLMEYFPVDNTVNPIDRLSPELKQDPFWVKRSATEKLYTDFYVGDADPAQPLCSPIKADEAALSTFPDCLILSAGEDSLRDDTEAFALRLIKAGVCVTAQRIPEAMHGFTTNRTPGWERALDAHCKFFREHLQ